MGELDDLLKGVQGRIREERGPLARLRALPAGVRALFGMVAGILLVAASAAMWWNDRGTLGPRDLAMSVAACVALACVALVVAVRPLHRRALPRAIELLVVVAGVTAPPVAILIRDGTWLAATRGLHCLWRGLLVASAATAVAWCLDRDAHQRSLPRILASLFGGLIGVLAMETACRAGDTAHALVMHAPIVVIAVVVYAAVGHVTRRAAMK